MWERRKHTNSCDIPSFNIYSIDMWFMCAVVSSMSSFTAWTKKSFNPVGWTDEVWYSGLYHPSRPLLYGKLVYIWFVAFIMNYRHINNLPFSLFLSITFRLIPPQSSLMVHLFMNMKGSIQLTASWSSYRYCYTYNYTLTYWVQQIWTYSNLLPHLLNTSLADIDYSWLCRIW